MTRWDGAYRDASAAPAPSPTAPTPTERSAVAGRVIAAVDAGVLQPDEAGRLASLAYHALRSGELARINRRVDEAGAAVRSEWLRRQQLRSFGWLAVCVVVSALMIIGLIYGLGPGDPL